MVLLAPQIGIEGTKHRKLLRQKEAHWTEQSSAHLSWNMPINKYPHYKSLNEKSALGENMIVDKISASEICIGDVFYVYRSGQIVCKLEISCPRRPCFKVDKKHGQKFGLNGTRQYCCSRVLTGWFFRLVPFTFAQSNLKVGDEVILKERKHPHYTLTRVAHVIYGKCTDPRYKIDAWGGTEKELHDLANMKEFGNFRWKEVVVS
eukprot:UN28120